jgi:hypothetical protein
MNGSRIVTVISLVALAGCATARHTPASTRSTSSATRESPLVGAWHLAWLELPARDGTLRRITDAHGSLIYTATGDVSVQVMYPSADAAASSGPVQYAQGGYEGSFGRYVIDEARHTVTHRYDGANVRDLVGKDLPRRYEIADRRLIIRSTRPDEHWSVAWER